MPRPKNSRKMMAEAAFDNGDTYSVPEFCRKHRISVQLFYKLQDQMPRTFLVGRRRLVSREAAAAWRAERESANAKAEQTV